MSGRSFFNFGKSSSNAEDLTDDRSPRQPLQIATERRVEKSSNLCTYCLGMLVVILLLFPVVTIPILFTLQAGIKPQSSEKVVVTAVLSTAPVSSLATLSTNLFGGVPVSISATGQVQQGGGTTIYKNIGAINTVKCPYYMSGTAIYEDIFLVSYENKVTGQGTINVMSVDSNRNTNLLNTSFISHDLYGLVTLNKGTGLFASISQNGALVGTDPVVIAGSVNKKKGYSINVGPATLYSTGASVDPSITSLSNTTFAIAYFAGHIYAYTKFGTVDPVTLAITLSNSYQFANDTGYNVVFTLTSISAYNYLVVFYGDSATPKGPLSAMVMKASSDGSVVTSDASAAFTPPYGFSTLSTSISGFFKATTLDSGDFVVAYSDSTTENGVTCVLIQYDSSLGQILFTSILQLTTGFSLKAYRYIRIATIGNGLQFMVVFPDSALGGAVVAAIGESVGGALIRTSANYVIHSGFNDDSYNNVFTTFMSLAVSKATTFNSRVAIITALTDSNCVLKKITDFSFLEILPKPVGVVQSVATASDHSNLATVAVSGVATGFTGLTVGMTYYATTSGKLVTDGVYYGRDGATQSNSAVNGYFYITDVADSLLVSAESQIGIAVASDTILLKLD